MRLIKPYTLEAMHAWVPQPLSETGANQDQLVITTLVALRLSKDFEALTDQALWALIDKHLVTDQAFDLWQTKPRGEVLLFGHLRSEQAITQSKVSLRCGTVNKSISVFGDRHWEPGLLGWRVTAPQPFTEMPLTWSRTFGGVDHSLNPWGIGADAEQLLADHQMAYLPNLVPFEIRGGQHSSPVQPDRSLPPVCFASVSPLWPRKTSAGTYDSKWLADIHPGPPSDVDPDRYMLAQPDQWTSGYWQAGDTVVLEGFIHGQAPLVWQLPAVNAVALVQRDATAPLERSASVADTIALFPDEGIAVLAYRSLIQNVGTHGRDLATLMVALEDIDQPKPLEHYEEVMRQRSVWGQRMDASERDADLMPGQTTILTLTPELALLAEPPIGPKGVPVTAAAPTTVLNIKEQAEQLLEDASITEDAISPPDPLLTMKESVAQFEAKLQQASQALRDPSSPNVAEILLKTFTDSAGGGQGERPDGLFAELAEPQALEALNFTPAQKAGLADQLQKMGEGLQQSMAHLPAMQEAQSKLPVELQSVIKGELPAPGFAATLLDMTQSSELPLHLMPETITGTTGQQALLQTELQVANAACADIGQARVDTGLNQAASIDPLKALQEAACGAFSMTGKPLPDGSPNPLKTLFYAENQQLPAWAAVQAIQLEKNTVLQQEIESLAESKEFATLLTQVQSQQPLSADALKDIARQLSTIVTEESTTQAEAKASEAALFETQTEAEATELNPGLAVSDLDAEPTLQLPPLVGNEDATRRMARDAHWQEPISPEIASALGATLLAATQRGLNLEGRDFAGADLRGAQLDSANLRGVFLEGADFTGASLRMAQCQDSVWVAAQLVDANFEQADCQGANFNAVHATNSYWNGAHLNQAQLHAAQFNNSECVDIQLQDCRADEANFSAARLQGGQIEDSDFSNANFESAQLQQTHWRKARLNNVKFTDCQASSAEFNDCQFTDASGAHFNLNTATLRGCNLLDANFAQLKANGLQAPGSSWHSAQLLQADFSDADLGGANFANANLRQASFQYANLAQAALSSAILQGASFEGGQLLGAHLCAVQARGASFRKAVLRLADLTGANLDVCDLMEADLSNTLLDLPTHA